MAVYVSPGVYSREIDFSLYVPQLATTIFGIVTTASKGPMDEITLITDEASLISTFGEPAYPHYGLYAAVRYLRKGKQLKVVRVGTYNTTATASAFRNVADTQNALTISALYSGSWYNGIQVTISSGYESGTYKLTVTKDSAVVEVFDRLRIGATYESHVNYIETQINGVSEYISVAAVSGATDIALNNRTFSGGADGAPADDSDVVGSVGSPPTIPATGLQCFANSETDDVNMIAVPGRWERSIVTAIKSLCETRADCFGLIDPPDNLTVQQVVDWHNGVLAGDSDYLTTSLSSSYVACYYPWIQVYDGWNDQDIWVPPSGHIAQVIAFTDYVADPWWAPAGLNRAKLTDALDVRHSPTQGERDYMYSGGNSVNPIVDMFGQGIVIWGQRTCQRTPTSLDRINVRRLMLYLRKVISTAVIQLVFEPNDEFTWSQFVNLVTPFMETVKKRRGVYDFRVVCDETTNTAVYRDRNEMHGKVLLKPTKTAEIIQVDFTLLSTGARFEEFI